MADEACDAPNETRSKTRNDYYGNPEYSEFPVVQVTWYDALDYCTWRGMRLPTEAEWEKAARGTEGNIFPWGSDDANCGLANYFAEDLCVSDTSRVGEYERGASSYGVMDMAGNVWEWVSSLYWPLPYDAMDGREKLSARGDRVLRGGSWGGDADFMRASNRGGHDPSDTNFSIGIRCASSP